MSDVVFLGNGINRPYNQPSWSVLIEKNHIKYNPSLAYNDKSVLPMPMQIIVATNDNVDKAMQEISKEMNFDITSEQKVLIRSILDLPVKNIITANYTFEIEQAAGIKNSMHNYRKIRGITKKCTKKDKQFSLFKNYHLEDCDKTVWHIHGDIATPSTVIMGNYYYGKLLREIQDYIPSLMKRYSYSRKHNIGLREYSWVDSFLTKDVHILGFGLDFNEIDIWWLICCKKRNFPNTKIYFYQPNNEITADKRAMLKVYDVNIVDDLPFENHITFYNHAINKIKDKMKKEK